MGCDIHCYREVKIGGVWQSADEWVQEYEGEGLSVPFKKRFTERNYDLFGVLARGVRREFEFSFTPRGMPLVLSEAVRLAAQGWGGDGHNHSYLYLFELRELNDFLQAATLRISGMKDRKELAVLRESIATGAPNWDLLYPYCQRCASPAYEDFEFDVPASWAVGSVKKLIELFDGLEAENHRIVFWFDN